MKILYLLRHGKAEQSSPGSDADRLLSAKGEKQVKLLSKWFNDHPPVPQKLVSSHASRAYETASLLARDLNIATIDIQKAIYYGDEETLDDIIRDTDDNIDVLLLAGHNPSISDLANLYIYPAIGVLPTAGLAIITFDVANWKSIGKGRVHSSKVVLPEMLKKYSKGG
ncbi:histidine phosphatase family protein [Lentimicrobium sp.]